MKLVANIWLCVVCMALPTLALAGAEALYAPCAACHGAAAEGQPALGAPALAAQQEAYLQRQLRHFKEGVRGTHPDDEPGARMRATSATLTDSAISELAAYLAALPAPPVAPGADADLRNGNNYYQANCGACHGSRAEGNPALHAPALAWLDTAYLERQFSNFQLGLRGKHPADRLGRQMSMMAGTLPDEETLRDVIAFMQSLAPRP